MSTSKRIYGLDILRAIAILCVLLGHGLGILAHYLPEFVFKIIPDGVLLFFVLSGFLIGGILLKTWDDHFTFAKLKNFWFRRWFRTLPAYFTVLIILIVAEIILSQRKDSLEYLQYFFFLQNIKQGDARIFSESWSLTIEEWFYLSIPIAIFLSAKLTTFPKKKIVLFWVLFIIIIIAALRIYKAQFLKDVYVWDTYSRRALITRIDCIMYGFLGAYLYYYKYPIWNKKNTLFLIGILIYVFNTSCSIIFGFGDYTRYLYLITGSIAVLLVIPKLNTVKTGDGIIFKSITYISTVSYSLYLINYSMYHIFIFPLSGNAFIRFFLFYLWAFVASWILYKYIEQPFMNLRDRITK